MDLRLSRAPPADPEGCDDYPPPTEHDNVHQSVVFVKRGTCGFARKLLAAKEAGAVGVIVWSDSDEPVHPIIGDNQADFVEKHLNDVALVVLTHTDGFEVELLMEMAEVTGDEVRVTVEMDAETRAASKALKDQGQQILYANGHALMNTVLLF